MTHKTRRQFLKATVAAGFGYRASGGLMPRPSLAANEEIRFACIGVGGQGRIDAGEASAAGKIIAICDVDQTRLAESATQHSRAKQYTDWRKMLDQVRGSVDAVTISTPDHTHAPIATAAMQMGLHCFLQKPLTHSIQEARLVAEVARKAGVATQMGNQGTASNGLRHAAAFVRGGGLGDVREIHVWTDRPQWPQGQPRPIEKPPVPKTLNWNVWIGPAPMRPYHPDYHPFKWRAWWDFGTGALGDMGCHLMNLPFAACDLRTPSSITATTSGHNGDSYPAWSVITYQFAATTKRPAIEMKWYDGGKLPRFQILDGSRNFFTRNGAVLVGEKGTLYAPGSDGANIELIGADEVPEVAYDKSPGHFQEWTEAIRGGKPAMSNFPGYAGPLTETVLLGNLAVWSARTAGEQGETIRWDPKKPERLNPTGPTRPC